MPLRTFLEIAFDELCMMPKEKDPEFSKALRWIDKTANKEGVTTYQIVRKVLRVERAENGLTSV